MSRLNYVFLLCICLFVGVFVCVLASLHLCIMFLSVTVAFPYHIHLFLFSKIKYRNIVKDLHCLLSFVPIVSYFLSVTSYILSVLPYTSSTAYILIAYTNIKSHSDMIKCLSPISSYKQHVCLAPAHC